jgi:15-cis-phytoene desaturase
MQEVDVAIVGGGIAGLVTAVGLRGTGLRVAVFERDAILGGRARSWTDAKTGDPVHVGPHIFLSHYPNFLALLDRCGTAEKIVWEESGRFLTMMDGEREIPISSSPLPPPYHYAPSLFGDPRTSLRDLVSNWPLVDLASRLHGEEQVLRLDAMDALALLREAGVTEAFIERFWAFTALSIMNVPLAECSAAALLRFYRHLVGHADIRVGFADGGLGDVFAPACERLLREDGAKVRCSTGVAALLVTASGEGAGRVGGVVLDDGTRVRARWVVCALPPSALARLSRPEWERDAPFRDLGRFEAVPYYSVYLWLDRKVTHRRFWARAYRASDLNCDFYDFTNIHRGWRKRPSMIGSNVIYTDRLPPMEDEAIVARTLEELRENVPDARGAKVVHALVSRVPMAIHAPRPGTESLRPPVRTGIPGLLLSGDWIRTGFPSSMESAARAGWMAAEAILEDVGRPRRLAHEKKDAGGLLPMLPAATRWVPLKRAPRRLVELVEGA